MQAFIYRRSPNSVVLCSTGENHGRQNARELAKVNVESRQNKTLRCFSPKLTATTL